MQEAFLKIIHQHQRIIYKVSRMYRNNREDQEDLFQEIVYQLWKSYPAFRGDSKFSTWMYRIALNTAMASYRKTRVPVDMTDEIPEKFHPTDTPELSENQERLFSALRQLRDSEKAIISLFLEDYSYQEIAVITGITENHVGVKISRIKEKLRTIITK